MFTRSRRNLAYWFAFSMGSILVVFAGVSYSLSAEEQLQSFDQTLYKKAKSIASISVQPYRNRWQLNPGDPTVLGDNMPLNSDLVYARWYNHRGELVKFVGSPVLTRLTDTQGFQTVKIATNYTSSTRDITWLRQITLPILQNDRLVGYLQIAAPITSIRDTLKRTRLFLSLGVPITLGVIGITGWFLGGLAMQPSQRAYDQLQRFTADASHELRAPLAAILSNAQVGLLAPEPESDSEQRFRLEKIVEVAKSMSTLIGNLLFLSRNEGALDPASLKQVDLVELLRSLSEDATHQANTQNLTFKSHLPEQPTILKADPDLLKQAITNLLSNALKYTPAGGSVQLQLSTQSHRAIIQVIDDGVGIPETDLPHIFERFYRVDTARSRQTGGFGLGLAIAQQIIVAHRGKITASSKPGQGSTFQIELPLKG
jgi:two-component system, OmpR family, manganese sensing sensor histidine kinase